MLRPRIIPCLLVSNKGLVKTIRFSDPKYVGDPINAVRIFNEKEVDELIILDIDATRKGVSPDYKNIELWASECRMPLCYGGGVKSVEQAQTIFSLGVEKIALSSAAIENPVLISQIAEKVGNQSVVVVVDVKKRTLGGYEIFTHNATKPANIKLFDFIRKAEKMGAGEIVINSIDRDGIMKGYDIYLAKKVRDLINTPLTILGGAGELEHIAELIRELGIVGAAAGSLFVFKGIYRAVLINYPSPEQKDELIKNSIVLSS
ncbi:imidazole glycerol phosphate synthase [Schleiferia thermophila str. Yellowstone]|uniref:AglZ/HisF2 family acetamidino modification protein n=1 Tax=Schleiferia thermophila TaxID=884107 RepID=UPI0004E6AD6E|nr:AglZ/HisF2 family acetamidino modification protein [Schleiferia thermophila]KFD40145.1 imidazole glycerol phosphate synthase [Schleiferia thermophila str. Yellowstone]